LIGKALVCPEGFSSVEKDVIEKEITQKFEEIGVTKIETKISYLGEFKGSILTTSLVNLNRIGEEDLESRTAVSLLLIHSRRYFIALWRSSFSSWLPSFFLLHKIQYNISSHTLAVPFTFVRNKSIIKETYCIL
jgi:hypothetical protein